MTLWKRHNSGDPPRWWLSGPGAEPSAWITKEPEGTFGGDGKVLYLDCGDSKCRSERNLNG